MMDRSTTKEEYKEFMRKWRAVMANVNLPDESWKRDKTIQDEAWGTVFQAVYKIVPAEFWALRYDEHRHVWGIDETKYLLMNCQFAPNSYPHETRNP